MLRSLFNFMVLVTLLSACATSPTPQAPAPVAPEPTAEARNFNQSSTAVPEEAKIEKISLGLILREMNQKDAASLVLMNGLENIQVNITELEGLSSEQKLSTILSKYTLTQFKTKYYTFILDPKYQALNTLNLDNLIPKPYTKAKVNMALGADTPLFSALALLSHSTGLTLVADQAMGDALCGELSFSETPLPKALEALLQSARVQPSALSITGNKDYVLLHSSQHELRTQSSRGTFSPSMQKELDEKCSIALLFYTPSENNIHSPLGASKLHTVLSELSIQLGIPIKAEGKVRYLPVNPMVLNNVTRRQALDILTHQWMLPIFVYEEHDGGIVIRPAGYEK